MLTSTASREGPHFYREYTECDAGYYAILGSPNGASSMRMLHDHKAAIGYPTIERIIVLGDHKVTLKTPESRSFVILLSSYRHYVCSE